MALRYTAVIAIGVLITIAGWVYLLNGIEVKTCSTYFYSPTEFVGRIRPEFNETIYYRVVAVNLSNIMLRSNTLFTHRFNLTDTVGYIYVEILGKPVNTSYRGFIAINDIKNNRTVVKTDLNPFKSASRDNITTTLFFMTSLTPGLYELQLSLDTDTVINKLVIHGPSSQTIEVQGLEIKLEPPTEASYKQVEIKYVCDVSFSQALIASALFGAGLVITVVGAYMESITSTLKARTTISIDKVKPVKKKKR